MRYHEELTRARGILFYAVLGVIAIGVIVVLSWVCARLVIPQIALY